MTLVTVGCLFLLGLITDLLGRRTPLPRVTLLILVGVAIGPMGADLLPEVGDQWFDIVSAMALVMVGFLLGGELTLRTLRETWRAVGAVSIAVVASTAAVTFLGLLVLGVRAELALLLAGIATSTDPVATLDVSRELRSKGPFTRVLHGIVAVDDAWGLILFSVLLAFAQSMNGTATHNPIVQSAWEIGGAIGIGVGIGVPMAYLTGRVRPGEPTLAEALGLVLVCGGVAMWLDVSFLLASMVLGFVVANLARHHRRPFRAIEGAEWPFLILFFLLAGATMTFDSLSSIGVIGAGYLAFRVLGRFVGGAFGGRIGQLEPMHRHWIGVALLPQAGLAIGMALVAAREVPEIADVVLPVVLGCTVLFEIAGPIVTRQALLRIGEAGVKREA